jgi:hypothetical protein
MLEDIGKLYIDLPERQMYDLTYRDNDAECAVERGQWYLRLVVDRAPTHSFWLNLVERWFAKMTTSRIRRGSCTSMKQLGRAAMECVNPWDDSGRWFVWAKDSDEIPGTVRKAVGDG